MRFIYLLAALVGLDSGSVTALEAEQHDPVRIGLSAEFGHKTSTSAEAIRLGILTAIDEINTAGGVLGGRPLELVVRDNRSIPARGVADLRELASMHDLVAVFGGKFSPVVVDMVPVAHELQIPLLDPWAAADGIINNGHQPNFAFRLSLKDSWALPHMIDHARKIGKTKLGLLIPNNSWGRSSLKAAEAHIRNTAVMELVDVGWYNWGDQVLGDRYGALVAAGAQAILLVANEPEGLLLVQAIAKLPAASRLPVISHWGITGGAFSEMAGDALKAVDLTVVQTFTLVGRTDDKAQSVLSTTGRLFNLPRAEDIPSHVGFAQAYDLTHVLARAIDAADSTDRAAIRSAMETVTDYPGLIRHFDITFSPESHEALTASDIFMARFQEDGTLIPDLDAK